MGLADSAPVYVTREYGPDGEAGSYSQSIWMTLLVQLLVWANAVLWGSYGIAQAVSHIVGLL